jgi:glycosyltransferase involved in cell wall biosynthesis
MNQYPKKITEATTMSKIILFHQEFYFSGGAEHTIFDVMDYLKENNYEVACFAPLVNKDTCFPDKITHYPIKSFFPYFPFIPRELYIIGAALIFPLLALRFRNTDLFYGANQSGPFFAYIAAKIHKKPYVVYMPYPLNFLYPRNIDTEFAAKKDFSVLGKILIAGIKPFFKKIDYQIITKANKVFSEGEYATNIFKNIYDREIINCPAGTDIIDKAEFNQIDKWNSTLKIKNLTIRKPYILLTNRHVPKKKFEYALDVMTKIIENPALQNTQLVITGAYTSYTNDLQKKIKENNLISNILFTNLITEEEITTLYKNAALYIYTAPEEDYGKGIVQSLANGTPAVVWQTGGPGKIITNALDGFTIEKNNIIKFAEKVALLITDIPLNNTMATNARDSAKQKYSKANHKNILIKNIQSILKHVE